MAKDLISSLDWLRANFPVFASSVSGLEQALADGLGTASGSAEFDNVFLEHYDEDAVLLEADFISPPLVLAIPGLGGFSISVGHEGEIDVDLAIVLDELGVRCFLFETPIIFQCLDASWLTPVVKDGGRWEPDVNVDGSVKRVSFALSGIDVEIGSDGRVDITSDLKVDLQPVRIGGTGFVVEMKGLKPCLSDQAQLPVGVPEGSRGFAIDSVDVYPPDSLQGTFAPNEITAEGLFLGTGGFTGRLSAVWPSGKVVHLGGLECALKSLLLDFKQNSLVESRLVCDLTLPFFDQPINVEISIGVDSSLSVALSTTQPIGVVADNGLGTFIKPGLLEMTLDSIRFELHAGIFTTKLSGEIRPLFGGLKWPTFDVRELSIDSDGNVHLDGGWLDLPKAYTLDLHGFKMEITKLGFGKTDDGGKYVAFSGGVDLIKGIPAGASVEGARIIWYDDGRPPDFTVNGVGVELSMPDKLYFKGEVSYEELGDLKAFTGDITLNLPTVNGLALDGKVVFGSERKPGSTMERFKYFAIYLDGEFDKAIPLWATGLGLNGIAGLFSVNYAPDLKGGLMWYATDKSQSWYHQPPVGVTDLIRKWAPKQRSLGIGAGVTLSTLTDQGFKFHGKFLFLLLFPGPVLMIDGRANFLKKRVALDEEAQFHALVVLDARQGYFLIGVDAQWKSDEKKGRLAAIAGSAEAFFDFHDPGNWHFWLGKRSPKEQRIRATFASLFQAQSYFMLDPRSLAVGVWIGREDRFKWGPVKADFEAWLDANALVSFNPAQFHADMWLHGRLAVRVFRFKLGIGLDASLDVDLFKPFHIVGVLAITIDTPLKDFKVKIRLEWGPRPERPAIPEPFRAAGIAHPKTTAQWALPAPVPGVPVDCRPFITFRYPVNDHTGIAVNPAPDPGPMIIGDPAKGEGSARVFYDLEVVKLQRWDGAGWEIIARRPPADGVEYERELYGSWAPFPPSSGEGGAAAGQTQLMIWSKNPLDHTDNGEAWNNWIEDHLPGYPCPAAEPRRICVDFTDYGSRSEIYSPWSDPDQPEIEVHWEGGRAGVVLDVRFPIDGVSRGLGFEPFWPLAGPFAYVANERADTVQPVDLGTGLVGQSIPAGDGPDAIALTPDGSRCLVANRADATVLVISTATNEILGQPIAVGALPLNVAVTPDGAKAYVTSGSTRVLSVIDVARRRRVAGIELADVTQGIAILEGRAYVVHPSSSRLSTIDTTNDTVVGNPVSVPGGPRSVAVAEPPPAFLGRRFLIFLYLPGSSTNVLSVVDLQSGQPVGQPIPVGRFPTDVAVTLDRTKVYVTNGGDGTVSVIDAARLEVVRTIEVGSFPTDIEISADGLRALVTNRNAGTVSVIDVATDTLAPDAIRLGGGPDAIALTAGPIDVRRWPDPPVQPELPRIVIDLPPGATSAEVLFTPNPATPRGFVDPPRGATVEQGENVLSFTMPGSGVQRQLILEADDGWILMRVCVTLPVAPEVLQQVEEASQQIETGLELWRRPGEVLDPFTKYRLEAQVLRRVEGLGKLRGWKPEPKEFWLTEEFIGVFHTAGPPGLGELVKPVGSERGATGLEDLTPYVEQTVPITVPSKGERPFLPRPVYRAYDPGVLFNESYVASMYDRAQRDLGIYLFDQNDRPVRDAEGGLLVRHDPWGEAEEPRLDDTDARWQALVGAADCLSEKIDPEAVPRDQTLTAAARGQVLEADTVYEARLKPLLVREDFAAPAGWTAAPADAPVPIGLRQGPGQPNNWTDYRISCMVRPVEQGRVGVVFRYQDAQRFYVFLIEPRSRRRDLGLFDGGYRVLARSGFLYRRNRSYRVVVEAVGPQLRVLQDGETVFHLADATLEKGSVGLFPWPDASGQFSDLRIDDLREGAPVAYRFQFTTSQYANFYDHLHSYQDECWAGTLPDSFDLAAAAGEAVQDLTRPPADAEARAYEGLAEGLLGPAARQHAPRVEVTRVEQGGEVMGFLVRSPEPIDWRRTELEVERSDSELDRSSPAGGIKLTEATFGEHRPNEESVTLLLREVTDLTRHRLELQQLPELLVKPLGDPVLLLATFEAESALESWEFYDPGSGAAGDWKLESDALAQTARSGRGGPPGFRGTHAVAGDGTWRDYRLTVRLRSDRQSAGIGVLFRYVDEQNYYRLSFDPGRKYRRLVKREDGDVTVLWEDQEKLAVGRPVTVTVEAVGPRFVAYLDDEELFRLEDSSHPAGRVGSYCWRNRGAHFEHLEVRRPTLEGCVLFRDRFADGDLLDWLLTDELSETPTEDTSRWQVADGILELESLITGGEAPAYPGTLAAVRGGSWGDLTLSLRLESPSGGAVGAAFRGTGLDNYYRFSMDSRQGYRQLVKKTAGELTVLWQDNVAYDPGRWYRLVLAANGGTIRGYLDGVPMFVVEDSDHAAGNVALYCWNNSEARFAEVSVHSADLAFEEWLLEDSFDSGAADRWQFLDGAEKPALAWPVGGGEMGPPGGSWSALSEGTDAPVLAAAADGDELYIGGTFETAGGLGARGIARWRGGRWSSVGGGVDRTAAAFAIDGDEVFVGGSFARAGSVPARNIAVWNRSDGTWSALGDGVDGAVRAIAIHGDDVYVGGSFTHAGGVVVNRIARWHRSTGKWSALGAGFDDRVLAIAVTAGGTVLAGGRFTKAGGAPAAYSASWDGEQWFTAADALDGQVRAIAIHGGKIYVGGDFEHAGSEEIRHVASFSKGKWNALDQGLDGAVRSLAIVDEGVFAAGDFRSAAGQLCRRTARWDARAGRWREVGGGADDMVRALASRGSTLYSAGAFSRAGGVDTDRVAALDLAETLDAVAGELGWSDYRVMARWVPGTEGASGLVFRYSSVDSHYRLTVDPKDEQLRLSKSVAGLSTQLGRVAFEPASNQEIAITVDCIGDRLTLFLDAMRLGSVEDSDLGSGQVGLWSTVETGTGFRELRVAPLVWRPYYAFGPERPMPAGTRLRVHAGRDDSGGAEPLLQRRFSATLSERGQLSFPAEGSRLRLLRPGGEAVHQRFFLPGAGFRRVSVKVLRNADQTAFLVLAPDLSPFTAGAYRLRLAFHRDQPGDQPVLSEAGMTDPEHVTLDLPWIPVDSED